MRVIIAGSRDYSTVNGVRLVAEVVRESGFIVTEVVSGGLILFGALGWLIDKGYRLKLGESTHAAQIPAFIDCKYLVGLYKANVAIQADRLVASYIGKWMRLSAEVKDVKYEDLDKSYRLIATVDDKGTIIVMRFNARWGDRLSILRRGSPVKVAGTLKAVDRDGLTLYNCELE